MTYEGTKAVVDTLVESNRHTDAIEHLLKEVQRLHWVLDVLATSSRR